MLGMGEQGSAVHRKGPLQVGHLLGRDDLSHA